MPSPEVIICTRLNEFLREPYRWEAYVVGGGWMVGRGPDARGAIEDLCRQVNGWMKKQHPTLRSWERWETTKLYERQQVRHIPFPMGSGDWEKVIFDQGERERGGAEDASRVFRSIEV